VAAPEVSSTSSTAASSSSTSSSTSTFTSTSLTFTDFDGDRTVPCGGRARYERIEGDACSFRALLPARAAALPGFTVTVAEQTLFDSPALGSAAPGLPSPQEQARPSAPRSAIVWRAAKVRKIVASAQTTASYSILQTYGLRHLLRRGA
jgi:hypothetical protein